MQSARHVLTPDSLSLLQTVADSGSFAAAARALGLVPSAVTYRVRQIEDALDVLLFPGSVTRMSPKGKWHCHGSPGFHLFVLETEFVVCGLQHPDFSAWRSWQTQNGTASPLRSAVQAHRSLRVTSACLC